MKCISSNIKEIKIIDLNEEYPGLTSNVRWAVVSDMNYQELSNEFGEELQAFTPFLILTEEQGEEIIRYNRNQEKFDWRMRNKEDFIGYWTTLRFYTSLQLKSFLLYFLCLQFYKVFQNLLI